MAKISGRLLADLHPNGTVRIVFIATVGGGNEAPFTAKHLDAAKVVFMTCGLTPERAPRLGKYGHVGRFRFRLPPASGYHAGRRNSAQPDLRGKMCAVSQTRGPPLDCRNSAHCRNRKAVRQANGQGRSGNRKVNPGVPGRGRANGKDAVPRISPLAEEPTSNFEAVQSMAHLLWN
jgi:hypothetical protein